MPIANETITVTASHEGFAIVVPDRMSGWKLVQDAFSADRSLSVIRAGGIEGARVLPAIEEEQEARREGGRTTVRRAVIVDWQSLVDNARTDEGWYAVRARPGAQKMARALPDAPEHRVGESVIERNLRDAGIDVYMPAFWNEIRTHRGRRLRERRYPLFVGYVFIRRDPAHGFEAVRDVDGVANVLSTSHGPARFSENDIRFLMLEMFKRHQAYRLQRFHRIETTRFNRRNKLHAELGRVLPRGRSRNQSLRLHAENCIHALPEAVRKFVLGIFVQLDGLQNDETLDAYREAV